VLKKGQRCVVLLPDSVRNYMSKFLNDDWMWRQGFVDEEHNIGVGEKSHERDWWARRTVGDLGIPVSRLQLRLIGSTSARDFLLLQTPVTATPDVTCNEAVDILQSLGYDQLPVVGEDNTILGVVTEGNLTSRLMSGRVKPSDPVTKALYPQFRQVTTSTPLNELARMFDKDHFAVVVQTQKTYKSGKGTIEKTLIVGIVTRIDLLHFITSHEATVAGVAGDKTAFTPTSGTTGGVMTPKNAEA
jgi:cystathionine beta-synthase